MIVLGASLAMVGELLIGGALFGAGALVYFDWIGFK